MLQDWHKITDASIQDFIEKHKHLAVTELLLRSQMPKDCSKVDIGIQIAAWQKAKYKLPEWAEISGLIYASALALEQSSSEQTARYKSSLLNGKELIDLTGGMGIDIFYMSQSFEKAIHLEQQVQLSEITAHNFQKLQQEQITCVCDNAIDFLKSYSSTVDCIFIDPARRGQHQQKVFMLNECEPDITQLLPLLATKTRRWLLKLSPMLDISQALSVLPAVSQIHVVAVENECKELLFLFDNEADSIKEPEISTINLQKNNERQRLSFYLSEEKNALYNYAENVLKYIYEPNVAILKSGAFKLIAQYFDVEKLHQDSHLYTSNRHITEFPGRIFQVIQVLSYDKKEVKKWLPEGKANISIRNFPDSVAQIRKRTGLGDGGKYTLIGTTLRTGKPILLLCEAIYKEVK